MSIALWPVDQWRKRRKREKPASPAQIISTDAQISAPPVRGGRGLDAVLEVVREAFPDDPSVVLAVEVCLSAAAALCLKQVEGCPAILLEGPASGRKTTVLRFFPQELKKIVYRTDKFTPASFVTNISGKSKEELEKIDLLPRIAHKVFVVPEMRVIFSDRQEKLQENLGVLTRDWIAAVGAKTAYIEPGSPWENGYCESFNARFRDELLNGEIFYTLKEAQVVIEDWRRHYNTVRPHSALGWKPPAPETIVPMDQRPIMH